MLEGTRKRVVAGSNVIVITCTSRWKAVAHPCRDANKTWRREDRSVVGNDRVELCLNLLDTVSLFSILDRVWGDGGICLDLR